MRIGFDGRFIQDRYDGIGRYSYTLVRHLADAGPRHTFVVFFNPAACNTRFDLRALWARDNVRPVPVQWSTESLRAQWAWPHALQRHGIDIFHSPYLGGPMLASCRLVATVHDLIFDRYPHYMPVPALWPFYRALMYATLRRADCVVAISAATATDIAHYYRFAAHKVVVAHHGADPAFRPVRDPAPLAAVRAGYGLPPRFFLFVGGRRPHKNLRRLLEAFALVAETDPDLYVVLAGAADQSFGDRTHELAAALGISGRVLVPGVVAEQDLPALYCLAEALLLPSMIEGFGLPALEAMACGTPVIASNRTSLPEVVGDAALLVDPYDVPGLAAAMLRVLEEPGLRARLGARGRYRAQAFPWQRTAAVTLGAYESLAPAPSGQARQAVSSAARQAHNSTPMRAPATRGWEL